MRINFLCFIVKRVQKGSEFTVYSIYLMVNLIKLDDNNNNMIKMIANPFKTGVVQPLPGMPVDQP